MADPYRQCAVCGKRKLLRWYPLINPLDPLDMRRLDECNRCAPMAWRRSKVECETGRSVGG